MSEWPALVTAGAPAPIAITPGAEGLPSGATVNPKGSISLVVSRRVLLGSEWNGSADDGDGHRLIFRRLTGADYRKITRAANKFNATLARSIGVAAPIAERLTHDLSDAELVAAEDIVGLLLPSSAIVPDRAIAQPDGGFVLPLLYPASDGKALHQSLHFRPLMPDHLRRIGRPQQDKFMHNALHHSTMLPVWVASHLLDHMDAADYAGSYAIIVVLAQRAIEGAQPNSPSKRI